MDLFDIITLGGGLALFLFGMNVLSGSLEKLSGGRMEKTLEKLTNSVWKGILLGLMVTAVIQSSSATTVIVVGLVNAGILRLRSVIGVIMGANIGTTVTAQILRLGDLQNNESANLFLNLLKPTTLAPIIALAGIVFLMGARRQKYKDIGTIMLGFAVLFTGMFTMEGAVSGLKDVPEFANMFAALSNPFLGVLVGAVVTAIIQSSSASVGILQALSSTGAIRYSSAIPIILGQNIGTCVTSLLASIGTNKNAKRTAMVHLYFNIIGTVVFLAGVYLLQYLILPGGFSFWDTAIDKGGIANFHSLFNITITVLFIPFAGLLEKLAIMTIRGGKDEKADASETNLLDERLLVSPGLALRQCVTLVNRMGSFAHENLSAAIQLLEKYDPKAFERVRETEDIIDRIEDRLGNYIQQLTDKETTDADSKEITYVLHQVSDIERIGDYALNIADRADMLHNKQASFSSIGKKELKVLCDAVEEITDITFQTLESRSTETAMLVEPLEQTIDLLEESLKTRHIQRLKKGDCTVDTGIIYLELIADLERVADHCSNVAVCVIGSHGDTADAVRQHEYLKKMREENGQYELSMKSFMDKYLARIEN